MSTNEDGPGAEFGGEEGPRDGATTSGPGPASPARLRVEHDDGSVVLECALERESYTLGRAKHCDLCLPGKNMSREHATLERDERGCWWLSDRGSASGVFVNGKRLEGRHRVAPNDIVRVSTYRLRVGSSQAPPAPLLPPPPEGGAEWPPARIRLYTGSFANQEVRLEGGEVILSADEGATVSLDRGRYEGVRVVIRPGEGGKFEVADESAEASLVVNGRALRTCVLGEAAVMLRLGPVGRVQRDAREGFQVRYLPAGRAGGDMPLPPVVAWLGPRPGGEGGLRPAGEGAPPPEAPDAEGGEEHERLGSLINDAPTPVDDTIALRAATSISVRPPAITLPDGEAGGASGGAAPGGGHEPGGWPGQSLGQAIENAPTRPGVRRLAERRRWRRFGVGLGAMLLGSMAAIIALWPGAPPGGALPAVGGSGAAEAAAKADGAGAAAQPALSLAAPPAAPPAASSEGAPDGAFGSAYGRTPPAPPDEEGGVNSKKDEARRRRLVCQQTGDCG